MLAYGREFTLLIVSGEASFKFRVDCSLQVDEDAGVLETLRSQICYNLCLYAQKYDEEFGTYMEQFVTDVWELLVKTGTQTKYDALVSNALTFLSTVAGRQHYRQLFEDPKVLASICEKVIIPNMDFRGKLWRQNLIEIDKNSQLKH